MTSFKVFFGRTAIKVQNHDDDGLWKGVTNNFIDASLRSLCPFIYIYCLFACMLIFFDLDFFLYHGLWLEWEKRIRKFSITSSWNAFYVELFFFNNFFVDDDTNLIFILNLEIYLIKILYLMFLFKRFL